MAALANPDNTLALHCDVSDAAAVASRHGRDRAGASAGSTRWSTMPAIAVFAPLLETSEADWSRVLAVNLTGPFLAPRRPRP